MDIDILLILTIQFLFLSGENLLTGDDSSRTVIEAELLLDFFQWPRSWKEQWHMHCDITHARKEGSLLNLVFVAWFKLKLSQVAGTIIIHRKPPLPNQYPNGQFKSRR